MLALLPATLLSFTSSGPRALPGLAARIKPTLMFDGTAQILADAAILLPEPAQGVAQTAVISSAVAETTDPSWFDLVLVKPFEGAIVMLHDTLKAVGIDEAYGPAIITFTVLLKLLTFPLNKQQIESTAKMQAIQPAAKQLQEKYRNKDP